MNLRDLIHNSQESNFIIYDPDEVDASTASNQEDDEDDQSNNPPIKKRSNIRLRNQGAEPSLGKYWGVKNHPSLYFNSPEVY